jgi:hypothetical protein
LRRCPESNLYGSLTESLEGAPEVHLQGPAQSIDKRRVTIRNGEDANASVKNAKLKPTFGYASALQHLA